VKNEHPVVLERRRVGDVYQHLSSDDRLSQTLAGEHVRTARAGGGDEIVSNTVPTLKFHYAQID